MKVLSPEEFALRRDAAVRRLQEACDQRPEEAKAALRRVEERAQKYISESIEGERRRRAWFHAALPVALLLATQPAEMETASELEVVPDNLPEGVDWSTVRAPRKLKRWEVELLRATGSLSGIDRRSLDTYVKLFQRARELGVDIEHETPLRSYSLALSNDDVSLRRPPEFFASEYDTSNVRVTTATSAVSFTFQLRAELRSRADKMRTPPEWWDVAVLLRLALDMSCDGMALGSSNAYPWESGPEEGDLYAGRQLIWHLVNARTLGEGEVSGQLIFLLEQAVFHLRPTLPENAVGHKPVNRIIKRDRHVVFEFEGGSTTVRATRGARHLLELLSRPGDRINVWVLETGRPKPEDVDVATEDLVDPEGWAAIEKDLIQRNKDRQEAVRRNDAAALDRLDKEANELAAFIQGSTRPGEKRRTRKVSGQLEACRNRVRKAIRGVMTILASMNPSLWEHLDGALIDPDGYSPGYLPKDGTTWVVDHELSSTG